MRRVAILYVELGVVKNSSKHFNHKTLHYCFFVYLITTVLQINNNLTETCFVKNILKKQTYKWAYIINFEPLKH